MQDSCYSETAAEGEVGDCSLVQLLIYIVHFLFFLVVDLCCLF